jgi:pilus assembly protein Flp/PilA
VKAFASDTGGATAIEYTLIAMLIALVIITGLSTIGNNINAVISGIAPHLL